MIKDSLIKEMLQEARNELYSWNTNDLTCQLAKEVMCIGLSKLKLFYQELNLDPNEIIVIFGPDGSVTRNKERFKKGVGYGCLVVTREFIFPNLLHPNACGYGLYRIDELPRLKHLMDRLNELKMKGVPIGDQIGKWDVWKSNHFIDILKLDKKHPSFSQFDDWLLPGNYVLIHSSQQIEKDRLRYWNKEEFTKVKTPLGFIEGLAGNSCQEYLKFFQKIEQYSKEKRNSIAKTLFKEENVTCIANPTHQGYYKENGYYIMRLGLYNTLNKTGEKKLPLFPMGFNGYSFIYLYKGQKNLKDKYWTNNQSKRANDKGHSHFLKKANFLPHGGGYKLNYPYSTVKSLVLNGNYYFKLYDAPMKSQMLIQDIEALEYGYRGPGEILPLVDKLELGERVARFVPTHVIKF